MTKPRGRSHTTLTETASLVVQALEKLPNIKMIAPGEIKTTARRKSGARHLTIVSTTAGVELIITGQSVQKVAIHTTESVETLLNYLQQHKSLRAFTISTRSRKPGV